VLLQKILVLAVGLDTAPSAVAANAAESGDRTRERDLVLTLSLNLQEAQLVALATENGRLSVALRNPEDQHVTEGVPDLSSTSLLESRARTEIQDARRNVVPVVAGPVKIESGNL
jgi:Flp pilus assembly protein CpaB